MMGQPGNRSGFPLQTAYLSLTAVERGGEERRTGEQTGGAFELGDLSKPARDRASPARRRGARQVRSRGPFRRAWQRWYVWPPW